MRTFAVTAHKYIVFDAYGFEPEPALCAAVCALSVAGQLAQLVQCFLSFRHPIMRACLSVCLAYLSEFDSSVTSEIYKETQIYYDVKCSNHPLLFTQYS